MTAKFNDAKDTTKAFEVSKGEGGIQFVIDGNDFENPYSYMDFNLAYSEIPELIKFLTDELDVWKKHESEKQSAALVK